MRAQARASSAASRAAYSSCEMLRGRALHEARCPGHIAESLLLQTRRAREVRPEAPVVSANPGAGASTGAASLRAAPILRRNRSVLAALSPPALCSVHSGSQAMRRINQPLDKYIWRGPAQHSIMRENGTRWNERVISVQRVSVAQAQAPASSCVATMSMLGSLSGASRSLMPSRLS